MNDLKLTLFHLFILLCCKFSIQAQAQSPRQAGAADLNAWSRQVAGSAGHYTNPDTEDWLPYIPHKDDITAGGILDAGRYIEKPGGMHGFLKQDGKGHFVFEDGTPARFLGGQINPFPDKADAEWLVQWMRRHGLNFGRAHGFGLPSPEEWDRMDYLIYQCKQAGIYLVLTPIYWTEFEIIDPEGNEVITSSHVILFFNDNMEQTVRELWKSFYHHQNPYTGLRYADDPTLVAFELKNEDSPFWALNWIKNDLPVFWAEIQQQFSAFLRDKYQNTEVLREAWTLDEYPCALAAAESLEAENIDLFEMAGWHVEVNDKDIGMRPRKSDQTEFLHKKLTAFYARSYAYLRELGCKQTICGSNWRGHSYSMRHVLEADSHLDYLDQHDYFDHPQGGWRTQDAVFHNQSMLKSPQAGLIGNLAPRQVLNRPYTVSEWNIGAWNEHLMEASFTMIACGLLQGWDGLIQFLLVPRRPPEENPMLTNGFFNVGQNPSVVLQYPTLARLWHRQDIVEADPVFIRRIAPSQLNMPSAIPSRFFPEAFMLTFNEEIPEVNEFGHMLAIVGKVGNEFVSQPMPHYEAHGIKSYLNQEQKVAQSMSGELTWDWGQGYMLINTQRTQGVCGYIGGININTETISIESSTSYGLITLTTLNDKESIHSSNHLLLTALGRARNSGTQYGNAADRDQTHDRHASRVALPPAQRVAVLELGEPPIITEPIKGKVLIALDHPENATVFILDDLGSRGEKVASEIKAGKLELNLPGDHSTRFFEIIVR
ncbi:MAG: hypothetical protein AMS26_02535 [Bacteroides sp. SM23_62]|nr:MAG: hypothetical protein AMS26_02535 [Bacteroides sp. SM23_62]